MNDHNNTPTPAAKPKARFGAAAIASSLLLLVAIGGGAGTYLWVTGQRVYIENSTIEAPEIDLAPMTGGILEDMYVTEGDPVAPNQVVARVGDELIKAKVAGIVTKADAAIGENVGSGDTVVAMIDPDQLRVVGQIDENKGLDRIQAGQYAVFTVDAFGSQKFQGVVDEVSPQAQPSDVVFQISDEREEQIFDVKVRFDTADYAQLKDGMSARLYVYPAK
jgi:multidrug resistance efflux pump